MFQFFAPKFQVVATVIFVVMDGCAKGFQGAAGIFYSYDLRNFQRVFDFSFLVADAEPKAVGDGLVMGGDFGEPFITPPK